MAGLVYIGFSLALGGFAAMVDIWSPATMLDRADGRGKFASPKMKSFELVLFAIFIAIFWPLLMIGARLGGRSARKQ
jgi:hypothetical protein